MVLHQRKSKQNDTLASFRANDLDSMLRVILITTLNWLKKESRPSERIELGQYVRDFAEGSYCSVSIERPLKLRRVLLRKLRLSVANPQLLQRKRQNVFNSTNIKKMADLGIVLSM